MLIKKYEIMLTYWANMLWGNDEIANFLMDNPGKELLLFKIDVSSLPYILMNRKQASIMINGIKWTIMQNGDFKAKNLTYASVKGFFTDTVCWDIHTYHPDPMCFAYGAMPQTYTMKEPYACLLHPHHSYASLHCELPGQMPYITLPEKKRKFYPYFFHDECVKKGPYQIYALKTGDHMQYDFSFEPLLKQYTGNDQSFFHFHWWKDNYAVLNLMDNKEFKGNRSDNKKCFIPPKVVRYLAEEKKYDWAKTYFDESKSFMTGVPFKDECMNMENHVHLLQDYLKEYWNSIMKEMNLPDESNESFTVPVWQWEFIEERTNIHPGWLYYTPWKYIFNERGNFVLYFPECINRYPDLQQFLQQFYLIFMRMLIQYENIDFGFRWNP